MILRHYFLGIIKDGHHYVFQFAPDDAEHFYDALFDLAEDDRFNLSYEDIATMVEKITEEVDFTELYDQWREFDGRNFDSDTFFLPPFDDGWDNFRN